MGMTLQNAARSVMVDALVDLIDVGGAGTINIKSAASILVATSEVATLTFSATAFPAATNGVATASAITSDTSATGGTAGFYTIFSGAGTAIWQGLVATSGSDLNLSSLSIGVGDTVSISSFVVTQPAS